MRLLPLALIFALAGLAAPAQRVTFHKEVLPILQNRCQECHRAGEIGPASFMTYKETRPWAKAIRETVLSKKMPPWFADPAHGAFSNDRALNKTEIETLVAWADSGAAEGNPKDAPEPRKFTEGWAIPTPDHVVRMPAPFHVPASGKVDYQYVVVPSGLTEDRWVQMVEARPSARTVVHHVVVYIREPGNNWLRGEAQPGVPFVPPATSPDGRPRGDIGGRGSEILTIYTPGNTPDVFRPGQAKMVKAGSDFVFQLHYTASGKAASDQSSVGLIFAKQPPEQRILTVAISNDQFTIPPGDANHRVSARAKFANPATILSFFPHMHLRGKAFEYTLTAAGATESTLLKVPNYHFNWQLTYRAKEPIAVKPGDVLQVSGWFDNSPNNPYNPDPKAAVRFGEQSWEEMMIGFVDVAVSPELDRRSFWRPAQPKKTD